MLRGRQARSVRSLHYLVGGFRVTIGPDSNTPGPRTHIVGFTEALESLGIQVRLSLVSSMPLMGRFTRISQNDYKNASGAKIWVADLVRVLAALWCGVYLFARTLRSPAPDVIYERSAVLQSLSSFHAKRRNAVRVVEVNGILSRETARDRNVLKSEKLAAILERHVMRKADVLVAVSQALKDEVVDFAGVDEDKILVVPNGIGSHIGEIPTRQDDTVLRFGFVGSIVKWQHLDRLIQVFVETCRLRSTETSSKRMLLEILGDGAELDSLKQLVRQLEAEDLVYFSGRLDHGQSIARMASWNVGLAGHEKSSSSKMYHSPLKLYEYAGLGMALVCTPSADAETLRNTGVPVLFYNDTEELRESLDSAVNIIENRDAQDTAEQRRNVQEHHSWISRATAVLEVVSKHIKSSAS